MRLARALPIGLGVGILVSFVAMFHSQTLARTHGAFCYPLDDTFIHMTIARNLAHYGTFGVSPHEFASASSSVLWPLLLAIANLVAGDRLYTPLVLNVLLGVMVIVVVGRAFEREAPRSTPWMRAFWVAAVVLLAPLPTLAFIGMEHTLHVVLSILFVLGAAEWLASDAPRAPRKLLALAALAASARYEALFAIGIVAALAIARKRRQAAATILGAGLVPVVLFGIYSVAHGGLFLPTSVLVKGNHVYVRDLSDLLDFLGGDFVEQLSREPHMLALLGLGAAVFALAVRRDGLWSKHALRIGLSLFAGIAHIQLAKLGWLFRYEAYVVALILTSVGLFCADVAPSWIELVRGRTFGGAVTAGALLAASLGLATLARRTLQATEDTPRASANIFDQQMQSARFLARFFAKEAVVVNDIGAVAWAGDHPIVDLGGLATLEIARAKHFEFMQPPTLDAVAAASSSADVAIVYDDWFPESLPKAWVRAGRWRTDECRSCAFPVVSIYATRPEAFQRVVVALRGFEGGMPEEVHQEGRYTARPSAPDDVLLEGDVIAIDRGDRREVHVVGADGRLGWASAPTTARDMAAEKIAEEMLRKRNRRFPLVGPDGRAARTLPSVVARGLTPAELARRLGRTENADARVSLVRRHPFHAFVGGDVSAPGDFWADAAPTASAAVQRSGGAPERAVIVLREHDGIFERIAIEPAAPLVSLDVVHVL